MYHEDREYTEEDSVRNYRGERASKTWMGEVRIKTSGKRHDQRGRRIERSR